MIQNWAVNGFLVPVDVNVVNNRYELSFKYDKDVIALVRSLSGPVWHGFDAENPRKVWSLACNMHNDFVMRHLRGENVFERYDLPVSDIFISDNPLYKHQQYATNFILSRRQMIYAGEMGIGKTLPVLTVLSLLDLDWWYVGPKSGTYAIETQLRRWGCKRQPRIMTYEQMSKLAVTWDGTLKVPEAILFDEGHKLKNHATNRSKAAVHFTEEMYNLYGDPIIIVTTGTPAPKDPCDWFSLCKIVRPGILREGSYSAFKARLALQEDSDNGSGQKFKKLVSWRDDSNKCNICGKLKDDVHTDHKWQASINEVAKLYTRMAGFTLVQRKADCLDLPPKIYEVVQLTPSIDLLVLVRSLKQTSRSTMWFLNIARQLSDGFQYVDEADGERECPACNSTGEIIVPVEVNEITGAISAETMTVICDVCGGSGVTETYTRVTKHVDSTKLDRLKIDLEDLDTGRVVIWAGFTGSIDIIEKLCISMGWAVIRWDGKGVQATGADKDTLLRCMDASDLDYEKLLLDYPKVAFVGNAQSGGMALTLTAAELTIYFSNGFNGEARMQSEDRTHRAGMPNRAAIIRDYYHLPTDAYVHENLKNKRRLQDMSLEGLKI